MPLSLEQLYVVLLAAGLVLLVSIVVTRLATRVGLPSLLLFLGLGVGFIGFLAKVVIQWWLER